MHPPESFDLVLTSCDLHMFNLNLLITMPPVLVL